MPFLSKLTLRKKGNLAGIAILLVMAVFAGLLFYSLAKIRSEVAGLEHAFYHLQILRDLGSDTEKLAGATKSFILTADPRWEVFYDEISKSFDNNLEGYKEEHKDEKEAFELITKFEDNSSHLIGKELLIISKVKEEKIDEAKELFDA